jgi:hypothetical protein
LVNLARSPLNYKISPFRFIPPAACACSVGAIKGASRV